MGLHVLVIAPHLDDEVLGCGGTIVRHVRAGDDVQTCFIAHRVYNHKFSQTKMAMEMEHARRAMEVLGYQGQHFMDLDDERLDRCIQDIIIPLEEYLYDYRPEIVYSPFIFDNNQDHRATAMAVQVALRPMAAIFVKRWLMYETPSSTEQAPQVGTPQFAPTVYHDISQELPTKVTALQCYETELRVYPHPRSQEGLKALAMKRGMEAGLPYAEAFMLVRERNA